MRVWAVITFIQQVISTKAEGKVIYQFARLHKSNDWSSPDKKFGWEHFEAKKFLCKKFFWVKHFLVKKYDWVENALIKNVWKQKKWKTQKLCLIICSSLNLYHQCTVINSKSEFYLWIFTKRWYLTYIINMVYKTKIYFNRWIPECCNS